MGSSRYHGREAKYNQIKEARWRRWWQLPDVGVWPQMGMLMCFQRLVELQESTRILMDLGQPAHNPNHQYAELKARPPPGWLL